MRISDLSREAGVPVGTIRFYLRQGLLPPGEPVGRNQAIYRDLHLRRLRLIRALTSIAHLDLASVRALLAAISDQQLPVPALYDVINRVLAPPDEAAPDEAEAVGEARGEVDDFISARGWNVNPDAAARSHLAIILAALRRLGCDCSMDFFTAYADAAEHLTRLEIDLLAGEAPDRGAAVARSILLEVVLSALRRMAQEHHVTAQYGPVTAAPRPR